jgi:hypothetical protein
MGGGCSADERPRLDGGDDSASGGLSCEGEEESGAGLRRKKKMTVGAHA